MTSPDPALVVDGMPLGYGMFNLSKFYFLLNPTCTKARRLPTRRVHQLPRRLGSTRRGLQLSYTFTQGEATTPTPVLAPSSSSCVTVASPTASGVTYSWDQLAYETGYVASSGTGANGSKSGSASGTSATGTSSKSSWGTRDVGYAGVLGVMGAVAGALAVLL